MEYVLQTIHKGTVVDVGSKLFYDINFRKVIVGYYIQNVEVASHEYAHVFHFVHYCDVI